MTSQCAVVSCIPPHSLFLGHTHNIAQPPLGKNHKTDKFAQSAPSSQAINVTSTMSGSAAACITELSDFELAELKQAFEEFDKVKHKVTIILIVLITILKFHEYFMLIL